MSSKFRSLGHARQVRDSLAELAMDLAPADVVESICRGEHEWQEKLKSIQERAARNWHGNGLPNWGYLDELAAAIEFIIDAEAAAAPNPQSEIRNPPS